MKQSSHSPTNSPTKEDIAKTRRANPNAPVNPSVPNNVELTYYTLSGKEVNIRDEIQRPLSVNGVYTRWAAASPNTQHNMYTKKSDKNIIRILVNNKKYIFW